jgi:hypothetical protein
MARPLNYSSPAEETSKLVKAKSGVVYGFTVYNNNAAIRFIQLHDATSAPAEAAVPAATFTVATQGHLTVDYGPHGRYFKNGIYICNSTTDTTKTLGAADSLFDVRFE